MRLVSATAAREWKRHCLANPERTKARGLDPDRPPLIIEDNQVATIVVGANDGGYPPEAA
jgi:hypothetical protein